jgi:hypothetical protein
MKVIDFLRTHRCSEQWNSNSAITSILHHVVCFSSYQWHVSSVSVPCQFRISAVRAVLDRETSSRVFQIEPTIHTYPAHWYGTDTALIRNWHVSEKCESTFNSAPHRSSLTVAWTGIFEPFQPGVSLSPTVKLYLPPFDGDFFFLRLRVTIPLAGLHTPDYDTYDLDSELLL